MKRHGVVILGKKPKFMKDRKPKLKKPKKPVVTPITSEPSEVEIIVVRKEDKEDVPLEEIAIKTQEEIPEVLSLTEPIIQEESIPEVEEDLVECKICGKRYKSITYTHLKTHNITMKEYLRENETTEVSQLAQSAHLPWFEEKY